ncbi:MAG: hypothetical protein HYZ13_09055 [Acidobacteria bacterium]|nr:hypothetical protein [Acidobacteriota bacterium]
MSHPARRKQTRTRSQNLRILLETIRQVTGVEAPPQQVLEVLAGELVKRDRPNGRCRQIALNPREIQALLREYQHQAMIDRVATWGLRVFGAESRYADCYPQYVEEAKAHGFEPYALKTFQNRAFKDPLALKEEMVAAAARHRRKRAA